MPPSPIVSESHAGIGRRASRRPRILNVEQISDTKSVESFNGVAKSLKSDRAAENLKSMGSPDTVMATAPSPMVLTLPPAFTSRSAARKYWTIAIAVIAIIIAWQMIDSLVELSAAAVTLDGQFISGFTHLITINLDSAFLGAAFAGFVAQVVDGALGMGFGVTSTTIMVSVAGLSPLAASTCVHLAQLGTTCLSGLSHYSCGNVDMTTMRRMSPSGMAGAFAGATFLASMPSSTAILVSAGLLFGLGAYVLWRFALCEITPAATASDKSPGWSLLLPLGAWGGFVDATGGGGWGPVATTGLLADGRLTPTKVVGTVSAAEFLVTVAAVSKLTHAHARRRRIARRMFAPCSARMHPACDCKYIECAPTTLPSSPLRSLASFDPWVLTWTRSAPASTLSLRYSPEGSSRRLSRHSSFVDSSQTRSESPSAASSASPTAVCSSSTRMQIERPASSPTPSSSWRGWRPSR